MNSPKPMRRRKFLGLAALVPAAASLSWGPWAHASAQTASARRSGGTTLVLIELAGGNDGLNTVVPYADHAYYRLRPNLAIARDQVLPLDERVGLHPSLSSLLPLWKSRHLAVVQGVGYPSPDRSHFRSIEIWETASDSDDYAPAGWLSEAFPGHTLDSSPSVGTTAVPDGLILGDQDLGPLHGPRSRGIVMAQPDAFFRLAKRLSAQSLSPTVQRRVAANPALAHLLGVQRDIVASAGHIEGVLTRTPPASGVPFPKGPFGKQLETAARLIVGGAQLPVIKVTLKGFDTHANQRPRHARLLKQLSVGLAAFAQVVEPTPYWRSTIAMTYSEFGRRAASNGSNGTDHGTAAPHLVVGGGVKGGLYGHHPSLTALRRGDLVHTVDFRQLYATVMKRHFGRQRLPAGLSAHRPLGFLAS